MHPLFKCLETLGVDFLHQGDRAPFTPHRPDHLFALEVAGTDLVWRARDDLLSWKNAGLD
jgi:hypothetical protein